MGNIMKRNKGTQQAKSYSGAIYSHSQQQPFVQQSIQLQKNVPYTYGPLCQHGCITAPNYGSPQSLPQVYQNRLIYENDILLSNLFGWPMADINRLRHEFLTHVNAFGVIDRERFRKLFITALLRTPWEALERDAEVAFRSFDTNQTGYLDFNEFITTCIRLNRNGRPSPM